MHNPNDWQTSLYEDIELIKQDPFIQKLANGTLPLQAFHNYLWQDQFYLQHYKRALESILPFLTESTHQDHFKTFIKETLVAEKQVQENVLKILNPFLGLKESSFIMPFCNHYIMFLQEKTNATHLKNKFALADAVAAILPCFFVYQTIGNYLDTLPLYKTQNNFWSNLINFFKKNPQVPLQHQLYQQWVDNYRPNKVFDVSVQRAIDIFNHIKNELSFGEHKRLLITLKQAVQLERHFFQGAMESIQEESSLFTPTNYIKFYDVKRDDQSNSNFNI